MLRGTADVNQLRETIRERRLKARLLVSRLCSREMDNWVQKQIDEVWFPKDQTGGCYDGSVAGKVVDISIQFR